MAIVASNTCDGADGTTVTVANSGGTLGTAWAEALDATYTSAWTAAGSASILVADGGDLVWENLPTSAFALRLYIRRAAGAEVDVIWQNASFAAAFALYVYGDGTLEVFRGSTRVGGSSALAVPADTPARIEWIATGTAGTLRVWYTSPHSTGAADIEINTGQHPSLAGVLLIAPAGGTTYVDEVAVANTADWIGPAEVADPATVRVYDLEVAATPPVVVQVYDQAVTLATSQARIRVYDQAALVGAGSAATVRLFEQTVVTVPFVGRTPGPVWALRGGSWAPWAITLLQTDPSSTGGPGTGGGKQATLLDGNALDLATQSVEQDVTGWTAGEWAGDRSRDGNHSILLVTGQDGAAKTSTVAHVPAAPGDTVSASYWAYTLITGVQADVVITYYDTNGGVIATDSGVHPLSAAPVSLPTAVWTRTSLDSTAPALTASVALTAAISGPVSTAVHVDRAYLSIAADGGGPDPEAVALRATSTAGVDTGAGNLVVPVPAGTQAGDLLVFFFSSFYPVSSVSWNPAGWTLAGQVRQSGTGNTFLAVYYRRATGSEPATYTANLGTGQSAAGWMGAFTGTITTDPPVRVLHAGDVVEGVTSTTSPAATDTQPEDCALHVVATGSDDPSPYDIVTASDWAPAGAPFIASTDQWVPGVAAVYKLGATSAATWTTDRDSGVDWTSASIALIGQTSTPGGGSPPAAPTGLTAGTATSNSVPLSWAAVSGATSYKVYRDGTAVAAPTGTTYTATGLSSSTTYSFQVSAVNQYGESPLSSSVSATTTASGTLPAAPTGLTVGTVTSSSVVLSWSAVTGATMYAVYRGATQVATTTSTSYTATGLTASTPYTFQVSAINAVGEGAKSSSVSATTSSSGGGTTAAVLFAPRSPINTLIPSNATVASNSATLVSTMLRTKLPLLEWGTGATAGGTPIYEATSSTTRYNVIPALAGGHGSRLPYWPDDPNDVDWGPNPFAGYSIPWDSSWVIPGDPASREDDKWVAIKDPTNGLVYELWMTTFNYLGSGGLECWWGSVTDVNTTNGQIRPIAGQATGANISSIAGRILLSELQAGVIPHALTFAGDYARNTFVYPASTSDGGNTGTQWMPEGTRIRLNPAYNPEADSALLPYERIIARALIDYGAYLVDNAGEGTTFYVEKYPATINVGTVRTAVGIPDNTEWVNLSHIPWASQLQVLNPATNPGYY